MIDLGHRIDFQHSCILFATWTVHIRFGRGIAHKASCAQQALICYVTYIDETFVLRLQTLTQTAPSGI